MRGFGGDREERNANAAKVQFYTKEFYRLLTKGGISENAKCKMQNVQGRQKPFGLTCLLKQIRN